MLNLELTENSHIDVIERDTKRGPMVFFTSELRWDNQDGALVRLGAQTSIYY